ncbi:MAG: hypothetical protein JNM81_13795 [Rhodospirillaceae bacterium]|nr:hypothetical protein [Rhodospirillaceae bacterium]
MGLALRITRQLMTALSILVVLGSALSAAHAKTTHLNSLMAAASQPCHHALSSDVARTDATTKSPADLCLELCLSQSPDTSLVPIALTAPVHVVTVDALTYVTTPATLLPARPISYAAAPVPKLRRAPYPASPRLLI